jgi:uncharacterized protein YbjT (DUF2867 family)
MAAAIAAPAEHPLRRDAEARGWVVADEVLAVEGREAWKINCAGDGMRYVLPVGAHEPVRLSDVARLAARALELSGHPLAIAVHDERSESIAYMVAAAELEVISSMREQTAKRPQKLAPE